jgi:rhodanese-related sulfurtransferase
MRLVAWETPGHTFEHLSWVANEGGAEVPLAVFTGGSLLVGSAGRSDLLGMDLAEELARAQYRSVRRLATLPNEVQVLPTHGAGSFCVSLLPKADRTSTLGAERATNAALLAPDEETFVREQLSVLMRFPAYYPQMAPINRQGPKLLRSLPFPVPMDAARVAGAVATGARIVDGRDRSEFAGAHIPGSLNVELNESFGSYVGWTVPFDTPLVLVLPEPVAESAPEAVAQLVRVGWDRIAGHLVGGVEAWRAAGRHVRSYPLGTTRELRERLAAGAGVRVLDVRQPGEWVDGVVPGSTLEFVADLPGRVTDLPRDVEHWVICTNGHRAAIAASLLDAEGVPVRLVARSGILGVEDHLVPPAAVRV